MFCWEFTFSKSQNLGGSDFPAVKWEPLDFLSRVQTSNSMAHAHSELGLPPTMEGSQVVRLAQWLKRGGRKEESAVEVEGKTKTDMMSCLLAWFVKAIISQPRFKRQEPRHPVFECKHPESSTKVTHILCSWWLDSIGRQGAEGPDGPWADSMPASEQWLRNGFSNVQRKTYTSEIWWRRLVPWTEIGRVWTFSFSNTDFSLFWIKYWCRIKRNWRNKGRNRRPWRPRNRDMRQRNNKGQFRWNCYGRNFYLIYFQEKKNRCTVFPWCLRLTDREEMCVPEWKKKQKEK